MRWQLGLVCSVAGHAVALALLRVPRPPVRPVAAPAPPPLAIVPIEIDLIPPAPAPVALAPAATSPGRRHRPGPAGSDPSAPPASTGTSSAPSTTSPPGRPGLLAMRGRRADLRYHPAETAPPPAPAAAAPIALGPTDHDRFTIDVAPDGSVAIENAAPIRIMILFPLPLIVGEFDATDIAMHAKGMDPYARQKLQILDATRDQRAELGRAYRARRRAMTPQLVTQNLATLFATVPDREAQRHALLEMLRECDDTEHGEAARRLILSAYRQRFE